MTFYAHSGQREDRGDWQPLADHLANVASRAAASGEALGLARAAEVLGRFHDLGKYDPAFDRVLRNDPGARVDHSTAGGQVLRDAAAPGMRVVAEILAYAILGHHAGLPDKSNETNACLDWRLGRPLPPLDDAWRAHLPVDFDAIGREIRAKMRPDGGKPAFELSVAVRMMFSCLVDADFRDTEAFYDALDGRSRDRNWPGLQELLPDLRASFDRHMAGFDAASDLNRMRATLLSQIRAGAARPPGLFTLTVPTGGGKTLASLGFALDHAALHGHRRIIYAIPYTSIIDQTAAVFRDVLGEDCVLEHHSAIDTASGGEAGRDKARLAMEDWAAPVVVTTNVQLLESLFAARPSRCRKLHNIAGSVIVLDEAQTLPRELLLPTLAMLDTLAAHYGCTIVLCTATQPAFDSAHLGAGGLLLQGRELAPDPQGLARQLARARIVRAGPMEDAALVAALGATPQGFVIVNSRAHALALYEAARAEGLDGLVHLTTRQYPAHRREIIADIRARLGAGRPCRLIATSLIEAGVDLDFPCGWRAEAGLDSVIQAAGRVNREGRRPIGASTLTVFTAPEAPPPREVASLAGAMWSTLSRFDDPLHPEAIRDWFDEVYWRRDARRLGAAMVSDLAFDGSGTRFPFRTLAEAYRMIDTAMLPVIVPRDAAPSLVEALGHRWERSGALARKLQPYTVQIPERARALLHRNGKGSFHAPDLRGDQFFVLEDPSLYDMSFGLWWERADYLSADQSIV